MHLKFLLLFAVAVAVSAENLEGPKHVSETKTDDEKKEKRTLFDEGFAYGSPSVYSYYSAPTLYTHGVHTDTVITREVPVAVPHPVTVAVEKEVPTYPVVQKVVVPVDRPVAVRIPKPPPVTVRVTKHEPYPVDRAVPVAVEVPVVKHVPTPYAVKVPEPYPVPVYKNVAVPVAAAQPVVYEKHYVVYTQ